MCGICGIFSAGRIDAAVLRAMGRAIAHRGPDDEGQWIDRESGIGLGHRRLSIVDLSPLGHQPMESADGRWMVSYNGEIYNHLALRSELEETGLGGPWRGHSDTETLVAAIAAWGLEKALQKSVGMFALALWDRRERQLHLARDRFGEKPLYYGWAGPDFVFASELKALRKHPRFDNPIDRHALKEFAARIYIPAPLSIYERIFKLEPGTILTVTPDGAHSPRSTPPAEGRDEGGLRLARYWSYRDVMRRGYADPITDEAEALERLESALADSIKGQSVADVPVGAFLSGGIDSSSVVALYQKYSPIPVRTFSIGFEESGYDEAQYAKAVARHLGTIHHERYVTVKEAQDVIPLLPAMYDEPFADSSQIPTHLVSRFAREQVTVALSGDGGDELFAGYNRHFVAPRRWQQLQMLPPPMRTLIGQALSKLPPAMWNAVPGRRAPNFGAKIQKALRVAALARSFDDIYSSFLDEWSYELSPVLGAPPEVASFDLDVAPGAPDAVRMMYCDAVSYLPDDILCKVDRAAMAVSLETRVPFLDHRVAEVAAHIPLEMKIRGKQGKCILRELLYRQAPRALFERPKAGFAIPVGEWLKGPLRAWAEDLLDPTRMAEEGWFDPAVVHRRWDMHLSGRRDSTPAIWAILMFQAWLRADASGA
ncbi:MAG TPA: asparagine synthase (glutamine-hydrolyzing) [Allosphingosinicella sp.]|jgi:asparagine synthase (glutamine-hydrolysing)